MSKTVVITGASSGIGRSCVERMQRAGWRVIATVRKAADRDKLQTANLAGVVPVLMDVSDGSSITSAAAEIETHLNGQGLDGVVNVAGIGMVRPLEYATMARDVLGKPNTIFFPPEEIEAGRPPCSSSRPGPGCRRGRWRNRRRRRRCRCRWART